MTRILLVEDDDNGIQALCDILEDFPGQINPIVAKDRARALQLLEEDFYDLMILDLRIPSDESGDAAQPEFGFAVFGHAKKVAPGMPIYLLTGSTVEPFIRDIIRTANSVDIWGAGKVQTIDVIKKIDIDQFSSCLAPYISGPNSLEGVELARNGLQLTIEEERLLRIFSRRYQGTRCILSQIDGGLSGARVLRVRILNAQGGLIHHAVGKVGTIRDIENERVRYNNYIALLAPAATPRLLASLEFGGKATGAIFYGLADGHESSFFEFASNAKLCGVAIRNTEAWLNPWRQAAAQGLRSIREIRQRLLSDKEHAEVLRISPISWVDDFESRNAQTNWGCVHGDLHGGNVLLTPAGDPAVIDYSDIGPGPLSLDPITLELSVFFHPSGPLVNSAWPDRETAAAWGELERYLVGCPCSGFIRACREWARNFAAGEREIAGSAYSYLIRQLKYEGTNKQRIFDLLEGVRLFYDGT